jgi:hypothetical protein
MFIRCVCCVGSSHYDELITRSEESYRMCVCVCVCVIVCDLETSIKGGLGPSRAVAPQKEELCRVRDHILHLI